MRSRVTRSVRTSEEQVLELLDEAEKLRDRACFNQARHRARHAVERAEELLPPEHPLRGESLLALAALEETTGHLARAVTLAERALELFERRAGTTGDEDVASALHRIGVLSTTLGDGERAEEALTRALEIDRRLFGADHPEMALDLTALGALYERQGRFAEAERVLTEALEIDRHQLGPDDPRTAVDLSNLGLLLLSFGAPERLVQAEPLLARALEIHRQAHGERHPSVATDLTNLAGLHVMRGELGRAEPLLRRAHEIDADLLGPTHPDVLTGLTNLASLEAAVGRPKAALELLQRVSDADGKLLDRIFSVSSEQRRAALVDVLREDLEGFLSLVLRHLATEPDAVRAAFELVVRRKGLELEALTRHRDLLHLDPEHPTRTLVEKLRTVRERLGELVLSLGIPDGPPAPEWTAEVSSLEAREELLETKIARSLPELDLQHRFREIDTRAVANTLPEGSALVEFVRFDAFDPSAIPRANDGAWEAARYAAFVLPASEPDALRVVDLGEALPIEQAVDRLRLWLDPRGGTRRPYQAVRDLVPVARKDESRATHPNAASLELRRRVIEPLLPALKGVDRLLIVLDGPLALVPFEVLPDGEEGFLVDRYHILYLASARELVPVPPARTGVSGRPLVLADPDFDWPGIPTEEPFARLPGTRDEGRAVARLLGAELWTGAEVLQGRLLDRPGPKILHLATHGFFVAPTHLMFAEELPHDPLFRSGVALTGANTRLRGDPLPAEAGDGLLTAKEMAGLDLRGTKLVVLSACETGLGEVRAGEGVLGLRRAVALAGAESLIMSLWRVPDRETERLMGNFYQHLVAGSSPADALRRAQLHLRSSHPDPRLWGAFICQGHVDQLRSPARPLVDAPAPP